MLKTIFRKVERCVAGVVFLLIFLAPLSAFAEQITSFDADIELSPDSSFIVTEEITYDFENASRHGIFRYIPTTHPKEDSSLFRDRYTDISNVSVTLDGGAVPFTANEERDQIYLKIGDANRTISGEHTYTITYRVSGGLIYFDDDTSELYWNVTGNGWTVPIRAVRATLRAPEDSLMDARSCYSGAYGAKGECDIEVANDTVTFQAESLAAGEGLTIAEGLKSGAVARVELERLSLTWIILPLIVLWLLGAGIYIYRYKTAYKTDRTIIAQYEPYEDFKPMYTGLLFDGRLNPRDITASILYLAEQGYIKIRHVDGPKVFFFFESDDYEIELVRSVDNALRIHQLEALSLLFDGGYHEPGGKVTLSTLKGDLSKQRKNAKKIQNLRKDLSKDLVAKGFFERPLKNFLTLFLVLAAVPLTIIAIAAMYTDVFVAIIPFMFMVFFAAGGLSLALYRRRTRKGYEALDHLKGFEEFLSVTDKERFKFHNAPKKSPEQFMEYLPYAIAFGVEKEWAEVFKDITIPDPDWYEGGVAGQFSAVAFSQSIGQFTTALSSSAGTSSSASGGGGFSGGGGGGGGGGSW